MNDDAMRAASSEELFEAIVSRIEDPEVVLARRKALLMGAVVLVGAVVVTVVAGLGWEVLLAYCSTFVPGLLLALRLSGRRSARRGETSHRWAPTSSDHRR